MANAANQDALAFDFLDGNLTPQRLKEFEAWVRSAPEHADRVAFLSSLHQGIYEEIKQDGVTGILHELELLESVTPAIGLVDITDQDKADRTAKREALRRNKRIDHVRARRKRVVVIPKALFFGGIAAALLIGALLISFVVPDKPTTNGPLVETPASAPPPIVVGHVIDTIDAYWAGGKPVHAGDTILNRDTTLQHGVIKVRLSNGVEMMIEGPSTFDSQTADRIALHSGRVVSTVPEHAIGFTVDTPGLEVVDLGTTFAVEVGALSGDAVYVLDGEVSLRPAVDAKNQFEPVRLVENQGLQLSVASGSLEPIEMAPETLYADMPHPYVWAVRKADPVVYWRFEDDNNSTIANTIAAGRDDLQVVGSATLTDAGVIGRAARLTNRAAPLGYFETAGPIEALAGLEQYSIELWYYTDEKYAMATNGALGTLVNWYDPYQKLVNERARDSLIIELGNDFWQGRKNKIVPIGWRKDAIRIYPALVGETEEKREIYTAQDYPIRRWQHVVLVRQSDSVQLYLDGQLVNDAPTSSHRIPHAQIRLGRSIIGLLESSDPDFVYEPAESDPRALRGRLDEVALYDRPLDADEVAKHYDLATDHEGLP